MQSLAIYAGPYYSFWGPENVKNGIGGSETWAYEVALEFSRRGYYVILYAEVEMELIVTETFRMRSINEFDKDTRTFRYDYLIVSRYVDCINPWIKCDNIFIMAHDVQLLTYNERTIGLDRVKKVAVLSDWQESNLMYFYEKFGLSHERIVKTTNGFSKEHYMDVDLSKKTKSMVWSSSLMRGFFDLYRLVLLPLIQRVPDFEIHVMCGTLVPGEENLFDKASLLPNCRVYTRLPKHQLAELQKQSRVWIYPGTFQETFCITAVENAAAGCGMVCPLSYGLASTLVGSKLHEEYEIPILDESSAQTYIDLAYRFLTDDEFFLSHVESTMQIAHSYSWERTVDEWEQIFKDNL